MDSGDSNNPATGVWAESASPSGQGIRARATSTTGGATGGFFESLSSSGFGVLATGFRGVYAISNADSGIGMQSAVTSTTGNPINVHASNPSPSGSAIFAAVTNTSGTPIAVQAVSSDNGYAGYFFGGKTYMDGKIGIGNSNPTYKLEVRDTSSDASLYAVNSSTAGGANTGGPAAVKGLISSTTPGQNAAGVWGINNGTTVNGYGVAGYHAGSGVGVFGAVQAGSNGAAILGSAIGAGSTASAGTFLGNVAVIGNVSKSGGSFKIDHPLDPENKYLYHSFVESPDMMNVYNGNVVTDESGYATVELPDWFETLNKDFRYQLSVIDESAPDMHFVRIARKIKDNTFVIKSVPGNMEISWQVTGIRHDKYAQKHRIPVEEAKAEKDRGKYLNPDAYGLPSDRGIYHVDLSGIHQELAAKSKDQEGLADRNAKMAREIESRRAHLREVGQPAAAPASVIPPLTPAIAGGR